ncbi:hypothetical protein M885DRAFT_507572 [Pelagophyceae sp. CCMP2097]|nr:hypothetical protein M885DRAFT_507572 [Pelagophyceae sp. CCMP2097]
MGASWPRPQLEYPFGGPAGSDGASWDGSWDGASADWDLERVAELLVVFKEGEFDFGADADVLAALFEGDARMAAAAVRRFAHGGAQIVNVLAVISGLVIARHDESLGAKLDLLFEVFDVEGAKGLRSGEAIILFLSVSNALSVVLKRGDDLGGPACEQLAKRAYRACGKSDADLLTKDDFCNFVRQTLGDCGDYDTCLVRFGLLDAADLPAPPAPQAPAVEAAVEEAPRAAPDSGESGKDGTFVYADFAALESRFKATMAFSPREITLVRHGLGDRTEGAWRCRLAAGGAAVAADAYPARALGATVLDADAPLVVEDSAGKVTRTTLGTFLQALHGLFAAAQSGAVASVFEVLDAPLAAEPPPPPTDADPDADPAAIEDAPQDAPREPETAAETAEAAEPPAPPAIALEVSAGASTTPAPSPARPEAAPQKAAPPEEGALATCAAAAEHYGPAAVVLPESRPPPRGRPPPRVALAGAEALATLGAAVADEGGSPRPLVCTFWLAAAVLHVRGFDVENTKTYWGEVPQHDWIRLGYAVPKTRRRAFCGDVARGLRLIGGALRLVGGAPLEAAPFDAAAARRTWRRSPCAAASSSTLSSHFRRGLGRFLCAATTRTRTPLTTARSQPQTAPPPSARRRPPRKTNPRRGANAANNSRATSRSTPRADSSSVPHRAKPMPPRPWPRAPPGSHRGSRRRRRRRSGPSGMRVRRPRRPRRHRTPRDILSGRPIKLAALSPRVPRLGPEDPGPLPGNTPGRTCGTARRPSGRYGFLAT